LASSYFSYAKWLHNTGFLLETNIINTFMISCEEVEREALVSFSSRFTRPLRSKEFEQVSIPNDTNVRYSGKCRVYLEL
jgi:hypothetical protein